MKYQVFSRAAAGILSAVLSLLLGASLAQGVTPAEIAGAVDSGVGILWEGSWWAWTVVGAAEAHDGVDALRTPVVRHGESVAVGGVVEGPGVFRGWVRVSSERWHDVLSVRVDGVAAVEYSGVEQHGFEVAVPRGRHTVGFGWRKDGTRSEGEDAAWVDEVSFTPAVATMVEAADLTGTAGLTLGTPVGATAWRGLVDGISHAGGDGLFARTREVTALTVTVAQPGVVTFWSRLLPVSGNEDPGTLKVLAAGSTQVLEAVETGGWRRWRVLVAQAGEGFRVEYRMLLVYDRPGPEDGCVVDDFSVEPVGSTTLEEALDAGPGLSFTGGWQTGSPAGPGWLGWLGVVSPGLSRTGGDALALLRWVAPVAPGLAVHPVLRTTVTGPGRLRYWAKAGTGVASEGGASDAGFLSIEVRDPAGVAPAELRGNLMPQTLEWREEMLDVPEGTRTISWLQQGAGPALLDGMSWTPTPHAAVPPALAEAVELTGPLMLGAPGGWVPDAWSGAGFGNGDVLRWAPAGSALPLEATVTGPGWLAFSWQAGAGQPLGLMLDGAAESLAQPASGGAYAQWQQVARWLPAGGHTVKWQGPAVTAGPLLLDGLAFSPEAPAWVGALGGNGITRWEASAAPWTVEAAGAHDGVAALRTPAAGAGEIRELRATVTGPGRLHYWWKVGDPDPLTGAANSIWLDGRKSEGLTGNTGWQGAVVDVPQSGPFEANWIFQRSLRATLPGDGAWIDEVSFTPATTTTLGEAMDAPDLVWTSGGNLQLLAGPGMSGAKGGDLVRVPLFTPGPLVSPPAPAWIQVALPGPGIVNAWLSPQASSVNGPGVWIDGVALEVSASSGNLTNMVTGPGPHTWRLVQPARSSDTDIDAFSYTPVPLVALAEALDVAPDLVPAVQNAPTRLRGLADAAASHDGVDVLRVEDAAGGPSTDLRLVVPGPSRVRFWWRAEGTGQASVNLSGSTDGAVTAAGTFGWTEGGYTVSSRGPASVLFSCRSTSNSGTYTLWLDEVRIEPLEAVSLDEALHLPPGSVTTGQTFEGAGGTWQGMRPANPAPASEAYVALWPVSGTQHPGYFRAVWIDIRISGPALVSMSLKTSDTPLFTAQTIWPSWAAGYEQYPSNGGAVALPAGDNIVRILVSSSGYFSYDLPRPALEIKNLVITRPVVDPAGALDAPGMSFTVSGSWYATAREAKDSTAFSDDMLLRVQGWGLGTLETPVNGPGWLKLEADAVPGQNFASLEDQTGIRAWVVPALPATPQPLLPDPVLTLYRDSLNRIRPGVVRPVQQEIWVPAGQWKVVFKASQYGTLNHFSFVPDDVQAAAVEALDLPAGMTLSLPAAAGGVYRAAASHDGVDAVELRSGSSSGAVGGPQLELAFDGPAMLTGWMRREKDLLTRFWLDGIPLDWPPAVMEAGGWSRFYLPVTTAGPHIVSMAGGVRYSWGSAPATPGALGLDELGLFPLEHRAYVWPAPVCYGNQVLKNSSVQITIMTIYTVDEFH